MSRSTAEVKEMVGELESKGFADLRSRADAFASQVYCEPSYAAELEANLAPSLTTKIAIPSSRLEYEIAKLVGMLNFSFRFHDEPIGQLKRDEAAADKRELFYAYLWSRFNRGGKFRRDTHRHQSASPFAAWWLDALEPPVDKGKPYDLCDLAVINPLTVAFFTDDAGTPTVASRHSELSYMEIVRRYGGEGADAQPLKVLGEKFPYLRGGRNEVPGSADLHTRKAEVWVLDDGVTITHHVRVEANYHQVGHSGEAKDYPNPFGRPSLFVVTGSYNADAPSLVTRYRPLVAALARSQRNVDTLYAHLASIGASPPRWLIEASEAANARAADDGWKMPAITFKDDVAYVFGKPHQLKAELDAGVQELLKGVIKERDDMLPKSQLSDPQIVKDATAAAYLTAYESEQRDFDAARQSETDNILAVTKAIERYFTGVVNAARTSEARLPYPVTVSDDMQNYVRQNVLGRRGEALEIGPEIFDDEHDLEVHPVPTTENQKAQLFQLKVEQRKAGIVTMDQLIETVTEDVSGQVEKLEEEARYQMLGAAIEKMDLIAAVEAIRLDGGPDLSLMLQQSGMLGMDGGGMDEVAAGRLAGNQGGRTDPPAQEVPAVGVTG